MEWLKILESFAFSLVIHFWQQIRDLITHHPAAPHIRVNHQRTRAGARHVLEGGVEVDEPPVKGGGQLNSLFVGRELPIGSACTSVDVDGSWHFQFFVIQFHGQIRSQLYIVSIHLKPSHVDTQFKVNVDLRIIMTLEESHVEFRVVDDKIFPLKLEIQEIAFMGIFIRE